MRKVLASFAAVALALGGVLLPAVSASADVPPPPGADPGWKYGVDPTTLTACSAVTVESIRATTAGGWTGRVGRAEVDTSGGVAERPFVYVLGEPCYESAPGHVSRSIRFPSFSSQLGYTYDGTVTSGAQGAIEPCSPSNSPCGTGANTYQGWYVVCQSTQWSKTQTTYYASNRSGYPGQSANMIIGLSGSSYLLSRLNSIVYTPFGATTSGGAYSCPFLVEAHINVSLADSVGQRHDVRGYTWTALRAGQGTVYNTAQDEGHQNCQAVNWVHPDCYAVDPSRVDPVNFDTVCAYAPELEFGNWGWLSAWVGHMAKCLFVPIGGFDRNGEVEAGFDAGTAGQVVGEVVGAFDTFNTSPTCGNIIDFSGVEGWGSNGINTCDWTWASPWRTVAGWAMLVAAAIYLIIFVMRVVAGVINRRTPTPGDES